MALRLGALAVLALGAGLASAAGPVRVPEYGVFEQVIRASGTSEDVTPVETVGGEPGPRHQQEHRRELRGGQDPQ